MPIINPVFKKLNFKDHAVVYILDAPDSFQANTDAMSGITAVKTTITGAKQISFLLAFVKTQRQIDALAKKIPTLLGDDAVLWFAYPKGTSKRYTCDFNRDTGWNALGELGYEPVRMVAIDEDWSALRLRKVEHIKTMTRSRTLSEAGKKKVAATKKTSAKDKKR